MRCFNKKNIEMCSCVNGGKCHTKCAKMFFETKDATMPTHIHMHRHTHTHTHRRGGRGPISLIKCRCQCDTTAIVSQAVFVFGDSFLFDFIWSCLVLMIGVLFHPLVNCSACGKCFASKQSIIARGI